MRKIIFYCLSLLFILGCTSSNDDDDLVDNQEEKTSLKVFVGNVAMSSSSENIDVRLYETEEDLNKGVYLLRQEMEFSGDQFVTFEDMEAGQYWIEAYQINNKAFCAKEEVAIEEGIENEMTLYLAQNGSLEIFVKTSGTSIYWGSVKVDLYKSEVDMYNDNVYMSNYTDGYNPHPSTGTGAIFEDLEFGQYWASCSFIASGDSYTGWATTWVPKGVKTLRELPVQK